MDTEGATESDRINPLSLNSDQHEFSPDKIHTMSRAKSMTN